MLSKKTNFDIASHAVTSEIIYVWNAIRRNIRSIKKIKCTLKLDIIKYKTHDVILSMPLSYFQQLKNYDCARTLFIKTAAEISDNVINQITPKHFRYLRRHDVMSLLGSNPGEHMQVPDGTFQLPSPLQ